MHPKLLHAADLPFHLSTINSLHHIQTQNFNIHIHNHTKQEEDTSSQYRKNHTTAETSGRKNREINLGVITVIGLRFCLSQNTAAIASSSCFEYLCTSHLQYRHICIHTHDAFSRRKPI